MKSVRRKLVFCCALVFVVLTLSGAGLAGEGKPPNGLELACKFEFYSNTTEVYYCNENPLTLYCIQSFQQGLEEQLKPSLGELLLTFKEGNLVVEGLGLRESKSDDPLVKSLSHGTFQDKILVRDMIGIDPFPVLRGGVPHDGVAQTEYSIFQKYADQPRLVDVKIKIQGQKTTVQFWTTVKTVVNYIRKESRNLLGEFSYEDNLQGIPWVWTWDLNGDGNDEIVIGQMVWRRRTIYVFSSTPEKFKGVREVADTIWQLGDLKALPCRGSEMFEKGYIKRIPLQ